MTGWKQMVVLAAFAGCASLHPAAGRDPAVGRWTGEVDRNGWQQSLAFDIEKDGDSYRGDWRSGAGVPSEPLQSVAVKGDAVRLETDKLLFLGHLEGKKLSGTVSQKGTDVSDGDFSVSYDDDPRHYEYEAGTDPYEGP